MSAEQESDRVAAVPEHRGCLHVLHASQGGGVHLQDAVTLPDAPVLGRWSTGVQLSDVDPFQPL